MSRFELTMAGVTLVLVIILAAGLAWITLGPPSDNPCEKYRRDLEAGRLDGINNLERFERELSACNEYIIETGDDSITP